MTAVIQTEQLTKQYRSVLALDSLDLEIVAGEVYGYLGPNGSGKTTTIRLLLGIHRPTAGSARILGLDAWQNPVEAHRRVAYVAGEPMLWPSLTGAETLDFLGRLHGSVDTDYRNVLTKRFDLDPSRRVRAYSKGNRKKLQLIAAFAARPELLILDEPTSGLDPLMEVAFRTTVQEAKGRQQTVFLSSHILSEVEALCDRVGILRQGRLVEQGTLDQLRHLSAHIIEVTFAEPVPVFPVLPGVEVAKTGERSMRFQVHGSVGPLISALARCQIATLTSREPSLEEIFLVHYQNQAGAMHVEA